CSPRVSLFPYTTLFRSPSAIHLIKGNLSDFFRVLQFFNLSSPRGVASLTPGDHCTLLSGRASCRCDIAMEITVHPVGSLFGLLRSEEHTSELQSRENLV